VARERAYVLAGDPDQTSAMRLAYTKLQPVDDNFEQRSFNGQAKS